MTLTPVSVHVEEYPAELRPLLSGAKLYDSSCSPEARVIFIDKDMLRVVAAAEVFG